MQGTPAETESREGVLMYFLYTRLAICVRLARILCDRCTRQRFLFLENEKKILCMIRYQMSFCIEQIRTGFILWKRSLL